MLILPLVQEETVVRERRRSSASGRLASGVWREEERERERSDETPVSMQIEGQSKMSASFEVGRRQRCVSEKGMGRARKLTGEGEKESFRLLPTKNKGAATSMLKRPTLGRLKELTGSKARVEVAWEASIEHGKSAKEVVASLTRRNSQAQPPPRFLPP